MSVINRIEIASLLNKHGDIRSPWEAKMRHLVLNLKGQSTAMNMENGFGKTTLSDALIGILSRDRSLMRKTRRKMSPSKGESPWTHIRVEFSYSSGHVGQNDILAAAGDSVGGSEQWVFGMYGHSDTDPVFYYYCGRLEQLPVHSITADSKLQLFSNEHFKHSLKALKAEKPNDREAWLEAIKEHISRKELEQLASFQKEGGADKSQIFNAIKPRPGEKADQAFFYEVLAPQILAGASQGETDESEEYIEDLVINSGRNVSELRHRVNEKTADLQRNQSKKARLDELNLAANRLAVAVRNRDQARQQLEDQAVCLTAISQQGMPGIPERTEDNGLINELAGELAIRTGDTEPLLPLSVLARQTTGGGRRVEEYLESQQLSGHRHDRSSIVYHPDASWARGKAMRLYPAGKAIQLLNDSHNLFKDDADRINQLEQLQEAVEAFLDLDTNPFRESYLADQAYLKTLKSEVADLKKKWQALDLQREELETRDKEFIDNETVFKDAIRESLFTEQELNCPDDTEKQVQSRLQAVETAYSDFLKAEGRFAAMAESWKTFQQQYGNRLTPASLIEEKDQQLETLQQQLQEQTKQKAKHQTRERELYGQLQLIERQLPKLESELAQLQRLNKAFVEVQQQFPGEDISGLLSRLEHQFQQLRDSQNRLISEQMAHRQALNELSQLQPGYQMFSELFTDQQPEGLENRLNHEKNELDHQVHQLNVQVRKLSVLVSNFQEYKERFPDVEPENWLQEADKQYPQLLTERIATTTAVEDYQRQLNDLETSPVSPGSTDIEAAGLLAESSLCHQPLYQAIDELLPQDDKRKAQWLAQAHNLLFAPVLATRKQAEQAAELFARQRLSMPVFTHESLQAATENSEVSLLGAVIGYSSLAVKSLLDSNFIESLREQLQTELEIHQRQLDSIEQKLSFYNPKSDAYRLAVSATEAVQQKAEPLLLEQQQLLIESQQRLAELNEQLSDENRQLIRTAERYLSLGGDTEQVSLTERVEQTELQLENTEQHITKLGNDLSGENRRLLDQAEAFLSSGGSEHLQGLLEDTQALAIKREQTNEEQLSVQESLDSFSQLVEVTRGQIESVYGSGEKSLLVSLDSYLQEGGPEFMSRAEDTRRSLEDQRHHASIRASLKFDRIRAYLNAKGEQQDAAKLKKQIAEIKSEMKAADQDKDNKESEISRIQEGQQQQLQAIHQVDETAHRWLKQLSHFSADMLAELPEMDQDRLETLPLFEKAEQYLEACSFNSPDDSPDFEQVNQLSVALSEQLEQENIKESSKELKRQEKSFIDEQELFRQMLDRIQIHERQLFNSTEQTRLGGLGQADSKALKELRNIISTTEEQISRHSQTLEQLQETMSGYHERLYERIASIMLHAVDNLRVLRSVVSSSRGDNAYFIIDADTVDEEGVNSLVRSLFAEVEDFQNQIRNRRAQNLPVGSEEKQIRDLQGNLRKQIYRKLFTNVRIRLKHSAIRPHGRPFSLNEDMSEGQREAVSLMWLVKLSEFAIERELKSLPSQYRRRERKSSESVIILDGLFSKLSHKKLIEDSLESLRNTRGRFQMIGLIHNPNYENDPGIFPTYLVGNVIGGLQGQGGHVMVNEGRQVPASTVGRSNGEASLFHLHVENETA